MTVPPDNLATPDGGSVEKTEAAFDKGGTALVVGSDERVLEGLARLLRASGWVPVRAGSDEAALRAIDRCSPALIVVRIDEFDVHLIARLKVLYPLIPVLAILGDPSLEGIALAYEAGVTVCGVEPITEASLEDLLRRVGRRMGRLSHEREESLRLVDSARAISSSLLFTDIYPLTLDTLMRETNSNAAVGIFADPERGDLGVKAVRGLSNEVAERLAQIVMPILEGRLSGSSKPIDDATDPELWTSISGAIGGGTDSPRRFLLVPIPRMSRSHDAPTSPNAGAVLLLRRTAATPYAHDTCARATFLAVQAGIAFQNGALYSAVEERAYLDPLTGLYNTRYLYTTLEQEIERSGRYGHDLSVLFLDLDHFKYVNDQHNHLVGSAVLVESAHLIERRIRQVDSAVRFGGDEFTIVLVETTHAGALNVAERIRESVGEHTFQEAAGLSIRVTCSIGVASFPENGKQPRDLIEAADLAMYRAKVGRNQVCSASR